MSDDPDKLQQCGVELQRIADRNLPFVAGCSAWLACKTILHGHNQKTHDLSIGEGVGAWLISTLQSPHPIVTTIATPIQFP